MNSGAGRARQTKSMTADARRADVIDAAIREFGRNGLAGGSADKIASDCGISQPYLFRLFGTKKKIFLAAIDRTFELIEESWREEISRHPDRPALCVMAKAYLERNSSDSILMMQLQAYASSLDEEIGARVRQHFASLQRFIESYAERPADSVDFIARGLLINVISALRFTDGDRLLELMHETHAAGCEMCAEQEFVTRPDRPAETGRAG